MKILIPVFINILLVIAMYFAERNPKFKAMPYAKRQLTIGLLFGAVSCLASSLGIAVNGTVANVRDSAPLSAGLIFGAPAGIIAGFIGGTYRLISYFWGALPETTIACALATMLAGLLAAALRKFMFDNKKPTWSYAIVITVFCEVMHMLLILLTNMHNSVRAFELVRSFFVPMVIGNVVAVGLALLAVALISKDGIRRPRQKEHIAETFQKWLLACVVVAFLGTSTFTHILQNRMASINTKEVFQSAIDDVVKSVEGKSNEHLLAIAYSVKEEYEDGEYVSLAALAEKHGIKEINVVSSSGWITDSTEEDVINNYDMNSKAQSKEFVDKMRLQDSFVQAYSKRGKDESVWRKYAAVRLSEGGFIQVGYDSEQFHDMLDGFVVDATRYRHVGSTGFVVVCDEQFNQVSGDVYSGQSLSRIGIDVNDEMREGLSASTLYEATVSHAERKYESEECIFVFTFAEGYCIIAVMPRDEAMFMRDASLYTSIFMQVIIFAVLFLFIYILIKKVIINNLQKINNSLSEITDGNLNVHVDVRSSMEFASLSDDINSTVSTLKTYIAEAAARIDKELEYAKQIQLSALPTNFPNGDKYSVYAEMIAAKEVGGDFYDFYEINDTTVAFLAADVSGKGIPAAMFMMTAKTIIKDLAESGMAVNDIFTRANEKLCESNESGMFVTAWMGILDLESGRMQYANAGHNPPLLKRADGSFEYLRSRAGFVLAGMDGVRYRVNELELNPGDRIFLYTDGVTEATDGENRLYGEDRLVTFMNGAANLGARELLPALKSDIDAFVGDAPQFDDITMLMLDYKPTVRGRTAERVFPARDESLPDALGFIEGALEGYGCATKTTMAVCVAVEEVFVNVAHYAYGEGEGEVALSLSFNEQSRELTLVMSDSGVPFDPLKKPDPDITLSAEEREIGGLGIFIAKKTMDSIAYAYDDGKNVLTMIKRI